MLSIFSDMIEEIIEIFMDDFSVYGKTFDDCLKNLDKILQRCEEKHLVLNWENFHFMVREGIVLGHLVSKREIEVDRAKIEVIEQLQDDGCALITKNLTRQQRKITSCYPSSMRCWNGLQSILSFVSLMGIMAIIKSRSILMTKAKLLLLVPI